jgi:hypothetical protein
MRSIFYSLLSLATIASTLAVEPRASHKDDDDDFLDEVVPDTIFNGQTVPPMTELGTNLDKEISHGNWYESEQYHTYFHKLIVTGSLSISLPRAHIACA